MLACYAHFAHVLCIYMYIVVQQAMHVYTYTCSVMLVMQSETTSELQSAEDRASYIHKIMDVYTVHMENVPTCTESTILMCV